MTDDEFGALFEHHKNAVYQFAWRITNSPAVAEDIAQDTFLTLGEAMRSGTVRGDRRERCCWGLRGTWRGSGGAGTGDGVRWSGKFSGMEEAVSAAVAALPPFQRETLILATYEGFSLQQAADVRSVNRSKRGRNIEMLHARASGEKRIACNAN